MASSQIRTSIQELLVRKVLPVVVALDGGSGSGKSTIVSELEHHMDVAVVHVDDFFAADIPDGLWDTFTTEEKLEKVFDWSRLRKCAIVPLMAGQPAKWYAFDFVAGIRSDGTYGMQSEATTLAPADLIVLDGAYSTCPILADVVNFSILVDVPIHIRHARLASREEPKFLETWHRRWDPLEAYYFTQVRPPESFDLVVQPT